MKIDFEKNNGLVPAIVQDSKTGKVLMLAYMNEEAWEKTLSTGRATYYSRSRQKLWIKGETSGNIQKIKETLHKLNIQESNYGSSTGNHFFGSGDGIDSYSPVNGKLIAENPPEPDFKGKEDYEYMPYLTVRMVARIQGFPDDWKFFGKKTAAYRQVGNAFPPPVARALGESIKKCLKKRQIFPAQLPDLNSILT